MTATSVDAMAVVVPIHNEADHLGACLRSVATAASAVDVPTLLVTVLDRCSDDSRRVVATAADRSPQIEIRAVEGTFSTIGAVRSAGLNEVVRRWPHVSPDRIWTAHTDADSVVPPQWLTEQARFAASGVDLVLGTVVPDEPRDSPAHRMWWSQHELAEGHGAVHGANLGVRLDRLMDVGGFPDSAVDEDVLTVQLLKAAGVRWLATDTTRVTTSARRAGRIPNGFAAYMRSLDDLVSSEQTAQL